MTKKKAVIMGICVVIVLCFAVFVVSFYSPRIYGHRVERLLIEMQKDIVTGKRSSGEQINLGSITPFSWDTMYQFGGYTSTEFIDKVLGFESHLSPTYQEGLHHIVFVKNNKIVCCFITRDPSYWVDMPCDIGVSQDDANFALLNSNGYLWLSLI